MAHTHNWILTRTDVSKDKLLKFFECITSGCPNPHKMEVEVLPEDDE